MGKTMLICLRGKAPKYLRRMPKVRKKSLGRLKLPALECLVYHPVPGLVIELYPTAAIPEKLLAFASQAHAAAMLLHQWLAERCLQAVQPHRNGGLVKVQTLGDKGHAARLGSDIGITQLAASREAAHQSREELLTWASLVFRMAVAESLWRFAQRSWLGATGRPRL